MIRYTLLCEHDHEFEAWFQNSDNYDEQAEKGLVVCPVCGSLKTHKALMTPALSRQKETTDRQEKLQAFLKNQIRQVRNHIAQNYDDVGRDFSQQARDMHKGRIPERNIYGDVTQEESRALLSEGIEVSVLPEALIPRAKNKLH